MGEGDDKVGDDEPGGMIVAEPSSNDEGMDALMGARGADDVEVGNEIFARDWLRGTITEDECRAVFGKIGEWFDQAGEIPRIGLVTKAQLLACQNSGV